MMKNQKAARPKARKSRDWRAMETSLRIMGLFVEWIGFGGDGKNQIENKMALVTVTVGRNGNGQVVSENCHSVGESVPINIVETGAYGIVVGVCAELNPATNLDVVCYECSTCNRK